MKTALWIIAICEVIRILQNTLQLKKLYGNDDMQKKAYEEFIKSLNKTDKEFVEGLLDVTYKERYSYIGQTGYFIYCKRNKWTNNSGYWDSFCDTKKSLLMCANFVKEGIYEAKLYVRQKTITRSYVANIGNTVFLTKAEAEQRISDITRK